MQTERIYYVTGVGEAAPVTVVGNAAAFGDAKTICAHEQALAHEEIRAFNIPVSNRSSSYWPDKTIAVQPASVFRDPIENTVVFTPRARPQLPHLSRWQSFLFEASSRSPLWGRRLRGVVQDLAAVRPGPVLLYGDADLVAALSRLLQKAGRDTIRLPVPRPKGGAVGPDRSSEVDKPQGPSLSANPFFDWLRRPEGDLRQVGAVVFLGTGSFTEEAETIFDCVEAPAVFVATMDRSGLAKMTRLEPPAVTEPLPRISVISVSYNQAPFLEQSILSVIEQGYPNLDYIIIDGGSTDGSVEIIERYRSAFSHVVIEPDNGQSEALNKGFKLATGQVMSWLCSDDLLLPGSLRQVGESYRQHGADINAGGCLRIRGPKDEVVHYHYSCFPFGQTVQVDPYDILKFMRSWRKGNYFYQPEVFFSKRIWEASGAFVKEHLYYLMDYDMWLRMGLSGATVRAIPVPLSCSRVHDLQKTCDDKVNLHEWCLLMEEYSRTFARLQAVEADSSS